MIQTASHMDCTAALRAYFDGRSACTTALHCLCTRGRAIFTRHHCPFHCLPMMCQALHDDQGPDHGLCKVCSWQELATLRHTEWGCAACSTAACTARKLTESVASAASACCDSLLHAESLIQLGLIPKPASNVLRVPHVRQSYNWCGPDLNTTSNCRVVQDSVSSTCTGGNYATLGCACRDCGLACVLMVLKAAGIHSEDLASLRAACCTTRYICCPHAVP